MPSFLIEEKAFVDLRQISSNLILTRGVWQFPVLEYESGYNQNDLSYLTKGQLKDVKLFGSCKEKFEDPFQQSETSSLANLLKYLRVKVVAATAQWILLHLPSCGPWLVSQAEHLYFFQFMFRHLRFFNFYLNYEVKRTNINKKRPGLAHI